MFVHSSWGVGVERAMKRKQTDDNESVEVGQEFRK